VRELPPDIFLCRPRKFGSGPQAEKQRVRAEQRFNDVRTLAHSLMFDIHDSIKDLPGSTPARKLLVERSSQYVDSLFREANGDSSLQKELGDAYDRLGDVQGNPFYANLGDTAGALTSYRKAAAILEPLLKANPANDEIKWSLYANYIATGSCLEAEHDFPRRNRRLHSVAESP
jgi:hypothetical protein